MTISTSSRYLLAAFCVTALAAGASLIWSEDSTLGRIFLEPVLLKSDSDGIETVELDFNNGIIELNIATNRDMTCRQVIKLLAVDSFMVKNTTYIPMCQKVTPTRLRITYEGTSVV